MTTTKIDYKNLHDIIVCNTSITANDFLKMVRVKHPICEIRVSRFLADCGGSSAVLESKKLLVIYAKYIDRDHNKLLRLDFGSVFDEQEN